MGQENNVKYKMFKAGKRLVFGTIVTLGAAILFETTGVQHAVGLPAKTRVSAAILDTDPLKANKQTAEQKISSLYQGLYATLTTDTTNNQNMTNTPNNTSGIDLTVWIPTYFQLIQEAQSSANAAIEAANTPADIDTATTNATNALNLLQDKITIANSLATPVLWSEVSGVEQAAGIKSNRDKNYIIAFYNLALKKIQDATTRDSANAAATNFSAASQDVYNIGGGLSHAIQNVSNWINLSKLSQDAFQSGIEEATSKDYVMDLETFFDKAEDNDSYADGIMNSSDQQVAQSAVKSVLSYLAQAAESKSSNNGQVANKQEIENVLNNFNKQVDTALNSTPYANISNGTFNGVSFNDLISQAATQLNSIPLIDAPAASVTNESNNSQSSADNSSNTSSTDTGSQSSAATPEKSDSETKNSLPKTAEQFVRGFNSVAVLAIAGIGISLLAFRNKKQQH